LTVEAGGDDFGEEFVVVEPKNMPKTNKFPHSAFPGNQKDPDSIQYLHYRTPKTQPKTAKRGTQKRLNKSTEWKTKIDLIETFGSPLQSPSKYRCNH
jgi:hypothetical protein